MLEFILGILCFYLARLLYTAREKGKLPAFCKWLAFLLIFGIYLYFLITKPTVNILGFRRPLIWGIPGSPAGSRLFPAGILRYLPALYGAFG